MALCLAESEITADFGYWRLWKQEYTAEDRGLIASCRELTGGRKDV
jgi:hypothetical protein